MREVPLYIRNDFIGKIRNFPVLSNLLLVAIDKSLGKGIPNKEGIVPVMIALKKPHSY